MLKKSFELRFLILFSFIWFEIKQNIDKKNLLIQINIYDFWKKNFRT